MQAGAKVDQFTTFLIITMPLHESPTIFVIKFFYILRNNNIVVNKVITTSYNLVTRLVSLVSKPIEIVKTQA